MIKANLLRHESPDEQRKPNAPLFSDGSLLGRGVHMARRAFDRVFTPKTRRGVKQGIAAAALTAVGAGALGAAYYGHTGGDQSTENKNATTQEQDKLKELAERLELPLISNDQSIQVWISSKKDQDALMRLIPQLKHIPGLLGVRLVVHTPDYNFSAGSKLQADTAGFFSQLEIIRGDSKDEQEVITSEVHEEGGDIIYGILAGLLAAGSGLTAAGCKRALRQIRKNDREHDQTRIASLIGFLRLVTSQGGQMCAINGTAKVTSPTILIRMLHAGRIPGFKISNCQNMSIPAELVGFGVNSLEFENVKNINLTRCPQIENIQIQRGQRLTLASESRNQNIRVIDSQNLNIHGSPQEIAELDIGASSTVLPLEQLSISKLKTDQPVDLSRGQGIKTIWIQTACTFRERRVPEGWYTLSPEDRQITFREKGIETTPCYVGGKLVEIERDESGNIIGEQPSGLDPDVANLLGLVVPLEGVLAVNPGAGLDEGRVIGAVSTLIGSEVSLLRLAEEWGQYFGSNLPTNPAHIALLNEFAQQYAVGQAGTIIFGANGELRKLDTKMGALLKLLPYEPTVIAALQALLLENGEFQFLGGHIVALSNPHMTEIPADIPLEHIANLNFPGLTTGLPLSRLPVNCSFGLQNGSSVRVGENMQSREGSEVIAENRSFFQYVAGEIQRIPLPAQPFENFQEGDAVTLGESLNAAGFFEQTLEDGSICAGDLEHKLRVSRCVAPSENLEGHRAGTFLYTLYLELPNGGGQIRECSDASLEETKQAIHECSARLRREKREDFVRQRQLLLAQEDNSEVRKKALVLLRKTANLEFCGFPIHIYESLEGELPPANELFQMYNTFCEVLQAWSSFPSNVRIWLDFASAKTITTRTEEGDGTTFYVGLQGKNQSQIDRELTLLVAGYHNWFVNGELVDLDSVKQELKDALLDLPADLLDSMVLSLDDAPVLISETEGGRTISIGVFTKAEEGEDPLRRATISELATMIRAAYQEKLPTPQITRMITSDEVSESVPSPEAEVIRRGFEYDPAMKVEIQNGHVIGIETKLKMVDVSVFSELQVLIAPKSKILNGLDNCPKLYRISTLATVDPLLYPGIQEYEILTAEPFVYNGKTYSSKENILLSALSDEDKFRESYIYLNGTFAPKPNSGQAESRVKSVTDQTELEAEILQGLEEISPHFSEAKIAVVTVNTPDKISIFVDGDGTFTIHVDPDHVLEQKSQTTGIMTQIKEYIDVHAIDFVAAYNQRLEDLGLTPCSIHYEIPEPVTQNWMTILTIFRNTEEALTQAKNLILPAPLSQEAGRAQYELKIHPEKPGEAQISQGGFSFYPRGKTRGSLTIEIHASIVLKARCDAAARDIAAAETRLAQEYPGVKIEYPQAVETREYRQSGLDHVEEMQKVESHLNHLLQWLKSRSDERLRGKKLRIFVGQQENKAEISPEGEGSIIDLYLVSNINVADVGKTLLRLLDQQSKREQMVQLEKKLQEKVPFCTVQYPQKDIITNNSNGLDIVVQAEQLEDHLVNALTTLRNEPKLQGIQLAVVFMANESAISQENGILNLDLCPSWRYSSPTQEITRLLQEFLSPASPVGQKPPLPGIVPRLIQAAPSTPREKAGALVGKFAKLDAQGGGDIPLDEIVQLFGLQLSAEQLGYLRQRGPFQLRPQGGQKGALTNVGSEVTVKDVEVAGNSISLVIPKTVSAQYQLTENGIRITFHSGESIIARKFIMSSKLESVSLDGNALNLRMSGFMGTLVPKEIILA